MKTLAAFPVCLFILSILPGCLTYSLWDQEINHRQGEETLFSYLLLSSLAIVHWQKRFSLEQPEKGMWKKRKPSI